MRRTILALGIGVPLLCGCDPDDTTVGDTAEEDGERGGWGKADAPGSCEPSDCGGRASVGSCWCDELCHDYGDCCTNKGSVCDETPEPEPEPLDPGDGSWTFADVSGVPNLDDDDGIHTDFNQNTFNADDDLTGVTIPPLAAGERVELNLTGDTGDIRVWRAGEPFVGSSAGATSRSFDPDQDGEFLAIEFGDYGASGSLTLQRLAASGGVSASTTIQLQAAPVLLNHHLQPVEDLFAVSVNATGYSNRALTDAYEAVLGNRYTSLPGQLYGWDVWMQDEFQFGTLTAQGGARMDIAVDSIRNRGLDPFARTQLVGPDFIADTWGNSFATSYDSFGNLEVSPPVTVNGVDFPFGRIYWGQRGNTGPTAALRNFLASQEVQAPFSLDSQWLCVGHVDEFSTFVPDPNSSKGFKLLLADVPSAYEIIDSAPGSTQLPLYAADYGYSNVAAIRDDNWLRNYNEDLQSEFLDAAKARFKSNLGLSDSDIILIPTIFEHVSGCGGAALVPGMVNLIVADAGGQTHLFVPDPFFRSSLSNQNGDPFIDAFEDLVPGNLRLHFVDNWDVYHLGLGEIHCGTNSIRTPTEDWWTAATHLMGGN